MTGIYIATEDSLSESIADRLVAEAGNRVHIAVRMGNRGFGYLRKKLPDLAQLAQNIPVFLLTDLDNCTCSPSLIASWCGGTVLPSKMLFRVAVREVEAWLLADREGFSEFSGVPRNKISQAPESLKDPKSELFRIVSRFGRKSVKGDLLPASGGVTKVGLAYNAALGSFVRASWDPARAAASAESLARARARLKALVVMRK